MSKIDLNAIKARIRTTLLAENTTTAALDLSDGMTDRVKRILRVNLARIPLQPSFYPAVTIYYDNKSTGAKDIAINQLRGRREADINIKLAGVVFLNSVTDDLEDDADNECENLMENIEQVMRTDPTLGGNVKRTSVSLINYHNVNLSEDTMMRIGILDFQATTLY